MSYFAKVLNNKVLKVIVADDSFFDTFVDSSVGEWVECHDDGTKKMLPSKDFNYDVDDEIFYLPKPYSSWTLDENYDWQPPVERPADGGRHIWNEESQEWTSEY